MRGRVDFGSSRTAPLTDEESGLLHNINTSIRDGDIEAFEKGIQRLREMGLSAYDLDHTYALHIACFKDRVECARLLIAEGVDVNKPATGGFTPLMDSCRFNSTGCVRLLIENKADLDYTYEALGGIPEPLSKQTTALNVSCFHKREECLKLLLEAGADTKNPAKKPPLFICCHDGFLRGVELLIEHKADVNASVEAGYTPLMLASLQGQVECVRKLIRAGAKLDNKWNGKTAFMLADERNHIGCMTVLVEAGAEFDIDHLPYAIAQLEKPVTTYAEFRSRRRLALELDALKKAKEGAKK